MRLAVIEVGSRSVRLLVADVERGLLTPVARGVENLDLMRAKAADSAAIRTLRRCIDGFIRRAEAAGAEQTVVYGTEAIRRLASVVDPEALAGIIVLDPSEEALCAFTAALGETSGLNPESNVCVIDHGNGSLELALGKGREGAALSSYISKPLGADILLKELEVRNSDLKAFRTWAHDQVDAIDLSEISTDTVVIQGSVATKCAWMAIRPQITARYDAELVSGHRMTADALRRLIGLVERDPPSAWPSISRLINPHEPPADQTERLVTGCIVLEHLLARLGRDEFVVSAFGARFGVARLVGRSAFHPAQLASPQETGLPLSA